jgi:hypothetical protein
MKCRNTFWISLVCGISLACLPAMAQDPQQDAPPPPPNGQHSGPPPDRQQGSQSGLPPLPRLDPADQRDRERTISGPYRLTFTITEMEGVKKVSSQHFVVAADANAPPTDLRLGTKIPIETASGGAGASRSQTQITYIDIGLNINARLRKFANGLELSSNISQSAVDSQQALLKSPVIRQTGLGSTVLLTEDKPTTLGTMDELGSSRRLQVEVVVTKIP